jgi:uncharacterized protein YjiS (DUF1127 family)
MSTSPTGSCHVIPLSRRHRPGSFGAARDDRPWASAVGRAVALLLTWRERAQQRRDLQCLSDHMLRDIGLTRADVFAEASKPFWRP